MSLVSPKVAQPQYIYSNKVLFFTELGVNNIPIADTYVLYVRKVTIPDSSSSSSSSSSSLTLESQWDYMIEVSANRIENTVPKVVIVEGLEAATLYEAVWELRETANSSSYWGEINTFRTRYKERFGLRPSIPTPLHGADFTYALQAEFDEHINFINTLEEERAIDNLIKEGVGRVVGAAAAVGGLNVPLGRTEASLILVPEGLAFVNGFFQTGCALEADSPFYFLGARVFQNNHPRGYSFLSADNYPNIESEEFENVGEGGIYTLYAYGSAYINDEDKVVITIQWKDALLNERPTGTWLIGKVDFTATADGETGDASLTPISVDGSMADIIWSHKTLRERIIALESLVTDVTGGNWPKSAKELVFDPDNDPDESTYEAVIRIRGEIRQLIEDQLGGGAILAEQESLIQNVANNFARAMVDLGKLTPNGLSRIDGAWVLKGIYGDGVAEITLANGDLVTSPNFEGPGNIKYINGAWEV